MQEILLSRIHCIFSDKLEKFTVEGQINTNQNNLILASTVQQASCRDDALSSEEKKFYAGCPVIAEG